MSETRLGLLRRLASMAYETLLLLAIVLLTVVLPYAVLGAFAHRIATPFVLWLQLFFVLLLYFSWFWTHGGQTLPMKTWRFRLETDAGRPIPLKLACWRYVLCWPSIFLGGLGLWWALFDRDGQFLHDRLAGTRLVRSEPV